MWASYGPLGTGEVVVRKQLVLIGGCVLLAAGLAAAIPAISAAQSGKLVVIVEENESYGNIVGNTAQAPYLNQLISQESCSPTTRGWLTAATRTTWA